MANNFSRHFNYEGKNLLAVIIPQLRKNGMHYEVNIKGYPRFYMLWSPLGRYDIVKQEGINLPYNLVLAISDIIEEYTASH
jgi:hypothetical protein